MFLFHKRLHSEQRTERTKKRFVFLSLTGALFFAGAVAALSWGSYREEVTIGAVRIEGAETVSKKEIRRIVDMKLSGAYLGLINRANSFLYPRTDIEENLLESFPRLAGVSAYRVGFREIAVKVKERVPSYLWCGEEYLPALSRRECYFLDPLGVAFARAPYFSGVVYFELYGKMRGSALLTASGIESPIGVSFLPSEDFTRVIALKEKFNEAGFLSEKLVIEETGDVTFFFFSGLRLVFNLAQDLGEIFSAVLAAVGTEPLPKEFFLSTEKNPYEFLDARFENKIFYK